MREQASQKPVRFQTAMVAIAAVAALAIVVATLRMSEQAVDEAVEQREAAGRFLAQELYVLRVMAMTARSGVPGRLYLGIEDCFKARAPLPLTEARLPLARQTLASCTELELGRLQAQGGAPMADEGRVVLRQSGLLR